MQAPKIELKEIIWEITGLCKNGCTYCGSKDVWKSHVSNDVIIEIAKNIAKFPPKEIDISGGDPTLISFETHEEVTKILKDVGVKVKMLMNPKSFKACDKNIFLLYDWIGLSINTEEELRLAQEINVPFTVITNFNTQNLYLYDAIETFVQNRNAVWQVQFTITEDPGLAIYDNRIAIEQLLNKLNQSVNNNILVVPADNMNSGLCGAGMQSLGILHDGTIVPCLSMRSWADVNSISIANILDTPSDLFKSKLEEVWMEGFNDYRFKEFKCCKDVCKNIQFVSQFDGEILKTVQSKPSGKTYQPLYAVKFPEMDRPRPSTVMLYGVQEPSVVMYAVWSGDLGPQYTYIYSTSDVCQCVNPLHEDGSDICIKCGKKIV